MTPVSGFCSGNNRSDSNHNFASVTVTSSEVHCKQWLGEETGPPRKRLFSKRFVMNAQPQSLVTQGLVSALRVPEGTAHPARCDAGSRAPLSNSKTGSDGLGKRAQDRRPRRVAPSASHPRSAASFSREASPYREAKHRAPTRESVERSNATLLTNFGARRRRSTLAPSAREASTAACPETPLSLP